MSRADPWEIVRDFTYEMSHDDFEDGIVVTDAASGREIMSGTTKLGNHMVTILNHPLCCGCDSPIGSDGLCSSCEVIHADIAEQSEVPGDPLLKRRAA